MNVIQKAKEFAITAHWGQMYGSQPYIVHLDQVASMCKEYNLPEYVQAAAYLHDVVEDTNIHANQVSNEFGYEIATLVYAVTDVNLGIDKAQLAKRINNERGLKDDVQSGFDLAKERIRKETKARTYPKILSHPYGVHLKLADRICNVIACSVSKDLKMFNIYCNEAKSFERALKTPGVAESMWNHLDRLYGLYQERD